MRKYIATALLLFIIPVGALAIETPTGISQDDAHVWDALIVLITQLTNHIQLLTNENAQLRALCAPSVAIPQTASFGSQPTTNNDTIPVMTIQTDTPTLTVETVAMEKNSVLPYGQYYFNVKLVGTDGKTIKSPITVTFPDDIDTTSPYAGGSQYTTKTIVHDTIQFGPYNPTSTGTKTVTFTASGVTQSVTVVVE